MSSDQNTSVEETDGTVESLNTSGEALTPQKNPSEKHSKGRRRKRGLKKQHKQPKVSAAEPDSENCAETPEPQQNIAGPSVSPGWDSDDVLDCEINSYSDVMIRPVNVPKAPENSTQFIMDDHNECRLYMSFETPNPFLDSDVVDRDAAFFDIDWEYHTQVDLDSAYINREFEISYKSNRFDELLRLSREELIAGLRDLETRFQELSEAVVQEDPGAILERLQAELLELQEEHNVLKECNVKLTSMLGEREGDVSVDSTDNKHGVYSNLSDGQLHDFCTGTESVTPDKTLLNSEAEACVNTTIHELSMETEPCQSSVIHSCTEAESVNEQTNLSHLHIQDENSSDALPHSTVPDEHELNVLAV